ncbi:hypothetical protein HMSSN036_25830 [Paenibacillus macerans]|nr:hypothetical protein HMSSN036_25830 [Paenibacillus macerans]
MDVYDKLTILTDSAKYDVSCSSSGAERGSGGGSGGSSLGNAVSSGICHSFAADGRCISLLKVLMTNSCIYDCKYCVNRRSNDTRRAMFTPEELAELTINFYRRNYIEGLFLSSGIMRNPDYTTEQLIRVLELLRRKYHFGGYIHVKAIPGADPALISPVGPAGRPDEREHRTAFTGQPAPVSPGQKQGSDPEADDRDPAGHSGEQHRSRQIPPRSPVCAGRTKHPDDRRRDAGQRS